MFVSFIRYRCDKCSIRAVEGVSPYENLMINDFVVIKLFIFGAGGRGSPPLLFVAGFGVFVGAGLRARPRRNIYPDI